MKYIIILCTLCCVGCFGPTYIKVNDRYPVYAVPTKSEIAKISDKDIETLNPETKKKIIDTVSSLKSEIVQLRAILESYNDYAKKQNTENQ